MAIINKTGITTGGTIQAEHVTRAIDALSGVSTDSIVATGSFSGSFTGTLAGSLTTSGSLNITATPASVVNLNTISSSGNFAIPLVQPVTPVTGSMYVDFAGGNLYLYDGATWRTISL